MQKPKKDIGARGRSSFGRLAEYFGLSSRDETVADSPAAPAARPPEPQEELGVGGVDWGRRSLYRDPYRH